MAFLAVRLRLEGPPARHVASSARGFLCLGGLVHIGLVIERCTGGLRKKFVMADLAVGLLALDVLGVLEGDVPHSRLESQLLRWFLGGLCSKAENKKEPAQ